MGFKIENGVLERYTEEPGVTEVVIPNSVASIGTFAFAWCRSLTGIKIPDSVTRIGDDAFSGCSSLANLTIPDGVTSIGDRAFLGCRSLASIAIPDGVTRIGDSVFYGCGIRTIRLPDAVSEICGEAFKNCAALESINIPKKVKTIGSEAFRNCSQLKNIVFDGEPEQIGTLAFYGCWNLCGITEGLPTEVREFFTRMREGKITKEEAKMLYKTSNVKGVAKVNGFQCVNLMREADGKYQYAFTGNENFLIFPVSIGQSEIQRVPSRQIPERAIIFCNGEQFNKLSRLNRAILSVQWLLGNKMLRQELSAPIESFIKKYADDVARELLECEDHAVYQRFLEIARPKASLVEKLVELNAGNAEITAILLNFLKTDKSALGDLSLDEKPQITVSELNKLWTYRKRIWENGETDIELRNYKGHEKYVEIPEFIGKLRVKTVRVVFPAEVESVFFPTEDVEIRCSFRNCKAMTDPDGFVMVNVGTRRVITDYVGPTDIHTLNIPAGATEVRFGAFRDLNTCEAIFPDGFLTLDEYSFINCAELAHIYIPESVIHIPFNKYITIHAPTGSYAERYAKEKNIPFVAE